MQSFSRFFAVAFTAIFLLFSVVTGTLAWTSINQSARNELRDGNEILVDVELVKLEKRQDGTLTEIAVPGAVFALFTEKGEQIGGTYTTDREGRIAVALPSGDYYFEELYTSTGYTFDVEDGTAKTRYHFRIWGEETEKVVVTAYNLRLEGSLTVEKQVRNPNGSPLNQEQQEREFAFTVVFSDGGTYSYRVEEGELQKLASGGQIMLKHGQRAVFEGIPVGVLYTVTEAPGKEFAISSTGHRGTITTEGCQAVFTNIYEPGTVHTGSLVITKEVRAEATDTEQAFAFKVTFSDGGTYSYRIDDGELQKLTSGRLLYLKHGQRAVFEELPVGLGYTVTEAETPGGGTSPDQETAPGYIALTDRYEGTVTVHGAQLPFVNIHKKAGEDKGSLTIRKEVTREDGTQVDLNREFNFEITFTEPNGTTQPPERITLKAGESHTFPDLAPGTGYEIKETDAGGYLPEFAVAGGAILTGEETVVTFVNHAPDRQPAKLRVTKQVTGEIPEADRDKEFAFTLILNGQEIPFTLKAGETREFDAHVGDAYEVREEDYTAEGYVQSIKNGLGMIDRETVADGSAVEVVAINTFAGRPEAVIEGDKTWVLGEYEGKIALPECIIVRLKNGELLVEEQEVRPDENGNWHYRFTAPRYDLDGNEIRYTVEEQPIESFVTTYDGTDIINTYLPPVEIDPPLIEKIVKGEDGENLPETRFAFQLQGESGAPMPEGSNGSVRIITIDGSGQAELGSIIYTAPGVYTYTVTELDGGAQGWTYDGSVYTMTVTVTEKDSRLEAQCTLEREESTAGKPEEAGTAVTADTVRFINTYKAPGPDQETVLIAGHKTWVHGDNPAEKQPNSIIVEVYGDGTRVAQRQVSGEEGWSYAFTLPKYAPDGHEIVYTVGEVPVENYETKVEGYDLTNTYTPTNTGSDPNQPGTPGWPDPKTGDNRPVGWLVFLMCASGSALCVLVILWFRMKRRK